MSVIGDARADLEAAAKTVPGVNTYALGAQVTPPAVVVGPARLQPLGSCAGPATAAFAVWVIVALDDRALERLEELAPAVWAAIEDQTDAVVTAADPAVYVAGGPDLPCYELTTEHPI